MLKKYAKNLPRAGILAIPQFGSAIEKAIFGSSDDKTREDERKELFSAIDDLREKEELKNQLINYL